MKLRFLLSRRTYFAPLLPAFLAACFSIFVVAVSHGAADEAGSKETAKTDDASQVVLTSGEYAGTWETRDGRSGRSVLTLKVQGQKFVGHQAFWGGRYAGDDVTGKLLPNDDGTVEIEFKTKDGMLKSKAVFDGHSMSGSYRYRYMVGRNRKQEKGTWTLERAANSP